VPDAGRRGAIIVTDSVKFVVDCFPGVKRVAGGGYEIPSDRIPFADDTQPNTNAAADAAAADAAPLREINSEDDVAGAEGKAIENIEAQSGFAPDAPGNSDAPGDSGTGAPSRGGADADAAGLEEHSGDSNNEELAVDPKGYVSRRIVVSWDLYGDSLGVIDKWAHRGAHGGYKHHVTYDDPDGK